MHLYRDATLHLEAVLANEDVLKPGEYPIRLKVVGPSGVVYEKTSALNIPDPKGAPEPPLVFPAFKEDLVLDGPAGNYEVAVLFDRGAAALGRQTIIVGDAALHPKSAPRATIWDDDHKLSDWLTDRAVALEVFNPEQQPTKREAILIGGMSKPGALGGAIAYRELMARVARGSVAVFLSPVALGTKENPLAFVPATQKGNIEDSAGYFWGRDDIVKPHAIFDGLPSRCLMDLTFYRDIVPYKSFTEMDPSAEVVVPCFALGRPGVQGYWSGANLVFYPFGRVKLSSQRFDYWKISGNIPREIGSY